jgi:hypothetical protein
LLLERRGTGGGDTRDQRRTDRDPENSTSRRSRGEGNFAIPCDPDEFDRRLLQAFVQEKLGPKLVAPAVVRLPVQFVHAV